MLVSDLEKSYVNSCSGPYTKSRKVCFGVFNMTNLWFWNHQLNKFPIISVHAFGFLTGTSSLTVLACTSTSLKACLGSKNLLSILSGATKPGKEINYFSSSECKSFFFFFFLMTNSNLCLPPTLTDDKDLCWLVPRRLRLGGLHLLEELLKDPE